MKPILKLSTIAVAMLLTLGLTVPVATAQTVRTSKHDLGSAGGAQGTTLNTSEVCVFCHTPHGSNTGVTAPLWNKTVPTSASFTRYSSLGSATLDGEEAEVGSVSLACLSCHDGSQAMDVILNAPGSGGYNGAGAEFDLLAIDAMVGVPPGAPIPNLGKDLQNDHPVSIEYAGGACSGSLALCTPSAGGGDPDFHPAQFQTLNSQPAWWVDTTGGVGGTREKTDMILYTRAFTGGTGPSVECGSCHDPHNAASSSATSPSFMRIANDNSNVCLACHNK